MPSTEKINPSKRLSNQIHSLDTTHLTPKSTLPKTKIQIPEHELPKLKTILQTETLHTAIDGSQLNLSMTGAWSIKIKNNTYQTGLKIPPGSGNPSSTRAERGAYLYLLSDISKICHYYRMTKGKVVSNLKINQIRRNIL